jgi:hypothetical protein
MHSIFKWIYKRANYLVNLKEKINRTLYIASDAKKMKNLIRHNVEGRVVAFPVGSQA